MPRSRFALPPAPKAPPRNPLDGFATVGCALPRHGAGGQSMDRNGEIVWIQLLAGVALIAINAIFVAAEFALVSVRSTRIDQLVGEGNRRARIVQRRRPIPIASSPRSVGITMASWDWAWIAEPALAGIFTPIFEPVLGHGSRIGSHVVAGVIAYFVITLFHIVLGEQVPKMIALQRAEATILTTAPPFPGSRCRSDPSSGCCRG